MATPLRHQFVRVDGSKLSGTEIESDRPLSKNGEYFLKNSPWVEQSQQLPLAKNGVQPCHVLHTKVS